MASIQKTAGTQILALQSVASNTVVVSSAVAVTSKLAATVFLHFGRGATTALTEGAELRIEAMSSSGGTTGTWFPIASFKTQTAAANSSTSVTTSSASGQAVVSMSSTTGLAIENLVFILNTTLANSEWQRVAVVTASTSITLEENLVNTQGTSSKVYNSAEFYAAQIDCTAITQLRVVVNACNTGQTTYVDAYMVTGDTIS